MSYPSASLVDAAQPGSAAGETGTADHHNDPRTPSYVYRVASATQAPLIWCSGPSEKVTVRAAPNSMTNIDNMKKSRPTVRFLRAFLRFLHLAIVPAPFGLRGQARRTSTPRSPPKCLPKPSATLSWDPLSPTPPGRRNGGLPSPQGMAFTSVIQSNGRRGCLPRHPELLSRTRWSPRRHCPLGRVRALSSRSSVCVAAGA
jgi:hypothetical protein